VKFLLDTNIISEFRKHDRAHPNIDSTPVGEIGTSVSVPAEIRRGIDRSVMAKPPARPQRFLPSTFAASVFTFSSIPFRRG
jgi:predicted nucleic acid-binding protein